MRFTGTGPFALPGDVRGPTWWGLDELGSLRDVPRVRAVAVLWAASIVVAVGTGVLNVTLGWNGVELSLLEVPFAVTIYPPFVLSVLLALWLGPAWGAVAVYLANLASALTSGLSFPMSAIFAVAGAIETLMLWGSLVVLRVDPDLRRWRDLGWFLAAALVAAVTGSLAAILWNSSHGLDPAAGQRVWRGWVIGDLLQIVLIVLPLLRLCGPAVRRFFDRRFVSPPHQEFSYTHGVGLIVIAFALLGLVVFLGVHQALGSIELAIDARTVDGELLIPKLREIILVMALLSTALIAATGMFSTALARMGERQRHEARRDTLTGCLNRRTFPELYAKESERCRRLGLGLAVLFVDIDHFKAVNDEHGHAAGDRVLIAAARRIELALRATDLLFRWGGDEFLVLMPHTHREEVGPIGERVRAAIGAEPVRAPAAGSLPGISTSIGAAAELQAPDDPKALVARADRALYAAKAEGRNRVVVAAD